MLPLFDAQLLPTVAHAPKMPFEMPLVVVMPLVPDWVPAGKVKSM